MIQLGQIVYKREDNALELQLATMLEDNMTDTEQEQLNDAWFIIAATIESSLKRQIKELEEW